MKTFFISLLTAVCAQFSIAQSPPLQPGTGPGSSSYTHNSVTFSDHTSFFNPDGYWLFEPNNPKPDSADVVVFNHGYGVFNPGPYGQWIEHLVRKGNIVIFPKYQISDLSVPSTYTPAATTGIQDALTELQSGAGRVRPKLNHYAMIGHSYGGVITSNMAVEYATYGLPKPQAILLCEPGTGGINTGRIVSYSGMDTDYNMLIVVGDDDIVVGNSFGREIMDSTAIPTTHKNYITQYADNQGSPNLEASHNEPLAANNDYDGGTTSAVITGGYVASKEDAVDFYCYWKLADALLECTHYGTNCNYAFGDTPEQRNMGNWSDGTPAVELVVEPMATGLNFIEFDELNIYPNPAQDKIILSDLTQFSFQLFSLDGKIVSKGQSINGSIDISSIDKGSYLLQINNNGFIQTTTIIKQ